MLVIYQNKLNKLKQVAAISHFVVVNLNHISIRITHRETEQSWVEGLGCSQGQVLVLEEEAGSQEEEGGDAGSAGSQKAPPKDAASASCC